MDIIKYKESFFMRETIVAKLEENKKAFQSKDNRPLAGSLIYTVNKFEHVWGPFMLRAAGFLYSAGWGRAGGSQVTCD